VTTAPHTFSINLLVVKNILGLLLLIAAVSGVVVAAWAVDWRLGLAVVSAPFGYPGWVLATSEK